MELNENRPVNTAGITKEERVKRVYLRTVIVLLICIVVGRIGITLYFKNEYKNYVTVEAVVTDCFTEEGGDGDDDNYIYYVVYDYTYNGVNYRQSITVHKSVSIGSKMKIMLDPNNPRKTGSRLQISKIKNEFTLAAFLVCACAALLISKKIKQGSIISKEEIAKLLIKGLYDD